MLSQLSYKPIYLIIVPVVELVNIPPPGCVLVFALLFLYLVQYLGVGH